MHFVFCETLNDAIFLLQDDENEEVAGVPGGHPVVSVVIVNHPLQGSLIKFGEFAIGSESDFDKC